MLRSATRRASSIIIIITIAIAIIIITVIAVIRGDTVECSAIPEDGTPLPEWARRDTEEYSAAPT
jgi:hypothetical protein